MQTPYLRIRLEIARLHKPIELIRRWQAHVGVAAAAREIRLRSLKSE